MTEGDASSSMWPLISSAEVLQMQLHQRRNQCNCSTPKVAHFTHFTCTVCLLSTGLTVRLLSTGLMPLICGLLWSLHIPLTCTSCPRMHHTTRLQRIQVLQLYPGP